MKNKFIKIFNDTYFIIKDQPVYDLDIGKICTMLQASIPKNIIKNLDVIYVGDFDDLVQREVTAAFSDGCIYVMNTHQDESSFVEDVVHEIAHSVEDFFGIYLYGDAKLEEEFLEKRRILSYFLKKDGIQIPANISKNTDFDENIDNFLYIELGYDILSRYIIDLFPTPYSVTSLREYWAVCFENFHTKKIDIKSNCPEAYKKIKELYKSCNIKF
jgi:hypothetical protein